MARGHARRVVEREAGRDPSELKLIVRANVEIHDKAFDKDRSDFTGSLEQIAEDIAATRKLGAAELVLDAQFSAGAKTAAGLVAQMERLWQIAGQS